MGKAFWRALAGDLICWDEFQAAGWLAGKAATYKIGKEMTW